MQHKSDISLCAPEREVCDAGSDAGDARFTLDNECGYVERVLVKRPKESLSTQFLTDRKWAEQGWAACPEFNKASAEHFKFCTWLSSHDARINYLAEEDVSSIDSLRVRESAFMTPFGLIAGLIPDAVRVGEPDETVSLLDQLGVPLLHTIIHPGRLMGTDLVWLRPNYLLAALTDDTNLSAIKQVVNALSFKTTVTHNLDCFASDGPEWGQNEEGVQDKSALTAQASEELKVDHELRNNDSKGVDNGESKKIIHVEVIDLRQLNEVMKKEHPNRKPRLNLCNAICPIGKNWVIACSYRLPKDFYATLKKLDLSIYDISQEEWNEFAGEVFMVSPYRGCIAESQFAEKIKQDLRAKTGLKIDILEAETLCHSRGSFKTFALPFLRGPDESSTPANRT